MLNQNEKNANQWFEDVTRVVAMLCQPTRDFSVEDQQEFSDAVQRLSLKAQLKDSPLHN